MERRPGWALLLVVTVGGCGGGSDGADASAQRGAWDAELDEPAAADGADVAMGGGACALTACGGDLTGTWQVNRTCYGKPEPLDRLKCPRLSFDQRALAITGDMVFRPDMTYQTTLVSSGSVTVRYDTTCPEFTCARLRQDLGADVTCSQAKNVCTCLIPYDKVTDDETGTYRLDQNVVVLKPEGLTEHRHQYCVAGTDLTMSVPLTSAADGSAVVEGVHTLSRR
jgi:hypothetical protein